MDLKTAIALADQAPASPLKDNVLINLHAQDAKECEAYADERSLLIDLKAIGCHIVVPE